jgi:hypothetical protein
VRSVPAFAFAFFFFFLVLPEPAHKLGERAPPKGGQRIIGSLRRTEGVEKEGRGGAGNMKSNSRGRV